MTNRLATTFIERHSKLRETRAEDTSAFLAAQLGQSRDRLKAVEERLRQIKEAYMGRLPEQAQAAIQNFFRKGNLIALRELALRRTAERAD